MVTVTIAPRAKKLLRTKADVRSQYVEIYYIICLFVLMIYD